MTKKILTFGIIIVVLGVIFIPAHTVHAFWPMDDVAAAIFKGIAQLLMGLSSLALIFSGMILDWVLKFTIVDMAKNIGSGGVGDSITTAWATLRDIANMCFIFVLLYAAFKTMFDSNFSNFQTTVKNIIIVALLINFSLFFSKVVIDASNIVAVGFYNSITVNSYPIGGNKLIAAGAFVTGTEKSLSAGYMKMLGVNTLYGSDILDDPNLKDPVQILIIGIMSAVVMLILSVILLIVGVMFAARFVILIFLMILSPLALIAYIIPGMKSQFTKWREALVDQSFFAPLYFALTWVVFKLGTSLLDALKGDSLMQTNQKGFTSMFSEPGATVAIIINYVLIIGFSIAALIFSKQMATKTAGFKAISGGIGTGVMGGAALAGRKSFGKAGQYIANNQWLRERAPDSRLARTALKIGEKTGSASFDLRASSTMKKVPGLGGELGLMGKAGGKGGYQAERESKIKRRMEFMEKNLQDNVTGTDVEKAMEEIGYGKEENRRLGRNAYEVERERKIIQDELIAQAKANTELRKKRYMHNLSQTRFITPNLYSGVSEDAEAARRMREGKKSKSKKDKIADLIEEITGGTDDSTTPPPPPAAPGP